MGLPAFELLVRDTEHEAVVEALTRHRVVVLTGPVGVGKSALARAAARTAVKRGAFERSDMVSLVTVSSTEDLDLALADWTTGRTGEDFVPTVLVLDAADGALTTLTERLGTLLDENPALSVIVTSREALSSVDAWRLELQPLTLDAAGFSGPAADWFVACVKRVRPDYQPTPAEQPILTELVSALDGLPLAIELCAPRLAIMSAAALLHRLRQLPGTSDANDALERALLGAWQGLSAAERQACACLVVFPGSFDAAAAEAVIARPDALDLLATLRSRSWIRSFADEHGEVRLSLLETVRRFVRAQAELAHLGEAEQRHAEYFAALADAADSEGIAAEHHNLAAVLSRTVARAPVTRREAEPALRVLVALHLKRDEPPRAEHLALLDGVLERTRDSGADALLMCQAALAAGIARARAGQSAHALRNLVNARHVAHTLLQSGWEALADLEIAGLLFDQGESDSARASAEAARQAFVRLGDLRGEARACRTIAAIVSEFDQCEQLLESAASLFRACGDMRAQCDALRFLARRALDVRAHDVARSALERAPSVVLSRMVEHDLYHDVGSEECEALAARDAEYANLAMALAAMAAAERGRFGEARGLLRAAMVAMDATDRRELQSVASWLDARLLGRSLPDLDSRSFWQRCLLHSSGPQATTPPTDTFAIGAEGRWFRVREQEVVSLERRRSLAKLLFALARKRVSEPDVAMSWQELQAAVWPGEQLLEGTGAHRVRVAISSLRKLGLSVVLQTRGDGYLLVADEPLYLEQGRA